MRAHLDDSFDHNLQPKEDSAANTERPPAQEAKIKLYDVCWNEPDQFHLKPEMRESASMVSYKDKLYLFGGIGLVTFNTIWTMDISK